MSMFVRMTAFFLAAGLFGAIEADAQSNGPQVVFQPEVWLSEQDAKVAKQVSRGPNRIESGQPSFYPVAKRFLQVRDSGADSRFDFTSGDTLTIESWVRVEHALTAAYPYIVGKGRTHSGRGTSRDSNQNYALRLSGGGSSHLSFLWMDVDGTGTSQSAHRWTSEAEVPADGRWHHVVVTYTFGTGGPIKSFIDGKPTSGTWDMQGNSDRTPVTDDDDLWVGASTGGNHLFPGLIEGLVIYRGELPESHIAEATKWLPTQQPALPWPMESLDTRGARTTAAIYDMPSRSWFAKPLDHEPAFHPDGFATTRLPNRYTPRGVIGDRPGPSVLRLVTELDLPPGKHQILLRTLDAARVYVGDKLVVERKSKPKLNGSAHNKVYNLPIPPAGVVQATAAHDDVVAEFEADGGAVRVEAYRMLGGDKRRPQLGEFLVAIATEGGPFQVVGGDWQPTDSAWQSLLDRESAIVRDWNRNARTQVSEREAAYWAKRHEEAATSAIPPVAPPEIVSPERARNAIDQFVLHHLDANGLEPTPVVDDATFLRRATLDICGRGPTLSELELLGQTQENSIALDRSAVIETLLASDEWADRWTPYWLDVLAENPALTKPTLNNSGPFRYYIHDALVDNWGFDRFVTNLVLMEGSRYLGGPAGFGMASQNDVPLAAKAHILGTAFLGVEMKCARCHDAPSHPFAQADLFSIAAMLNRKPLKVPASSSIPATPEELAEMVVKVSIKPGESIKPVWPFPEFSDIESDDRFEQSSDTRAKLAQAITHPENSRFREVVVNRIWTELIGTGLVDMTGDWTDRQPSHPELLKYLAREMLVSGDDIKHVTRLIMNSALYQRAAVPGVGPESFDADDLRGPVRRRLSAEQVVDSLHVAVGKPMRGEVQSFSQDGVQDTSKFVDLGRPSRAWQLVCTASERDRNSLSLPEVDSINELLQAYGWRPQRQEPVHRVDVTPTPLRPMLLANGTAAARLLDVTAGSQVTQLAVDAASPDDFVHGLFRSVLGRSATAKELARFAPAFANSFENRLTGKSDPVAKVHRRRVSWRNHFDPVADELVRDRWTAIEGGDRPTQQLTNEFRELAEDTLWVLVNSPEFTWVP